MKKSHLQKKKKEVEQSLFPSFHPSATFLLNITRRTQNCPLLSHTPSLCLLDETMTYYYTPLLLRYIGVSRRLHRVYVTHQKSGVNKKKRITHVLFFLKTSFSFLKSRLKKADILGYFHLFIRRLYDSELVFTLLTTYTYYAHKTCTSKKYMCAQSTIIDECKK